MICGRLIRFTMGWRGKRMQLELVGVMRKAEEEIYGSESLKLQSGYALLAFQTLWSLPALVGIHLKKEKSCLKKGTTSVYAYSPDLILQLRPFHDRSGSKGGHGFAFALTAPVRHGLVLNAGLYIRRIATRTTRTIGPTLFRKSCFSRILILEHIRYIKESQTIAM